MKQIITLLALSVGLVACSKHAETSYEDNSHTPTVAITFGAPSIDREWNYPEFVQYDQYLSAIPDDICMPKKGSEFSGKLFNKSIDSMQMSLLNNQTLDVGVRLSASAQQMNAVNSIVKNYINAHIKGSQDYSTEIAFYLGSTLQVTRNSLELIDEFVPTLDVSDPTYQSRMDGLEMVNSGAVTAFNGYLVSMTQDTIYDDSDYDILAQYLREHGSFFFDRLDGDVKKEFGIKLDHMSKSHPKENVRAAAETIINRSRNH